MARQPTGGRSTPPAAIGSPPVSPLAPTAGRSGATVALVGFSLQALDRDGGATDDYLSLTNKAMADLRAVIQATPSPPCGREAEILFALSVNNDNRVTPEQSHWLAERLGHVDRERTRRDNPEPAELLQLVDSFAAFCDACARRGGFQVS